MQEIYEFLKACGTYYLATADGDQPRVRPFGTIDIFDEKLTIQTGRKKDVAQQMLANPKIEICGFHKGTWIRVSASCESTAACLCFLISSGIFIIHIPSFRFHHRGMSRDSRSNVFDMPHFRLPQQCRTVWSLLPEGV